MCDDKYKRCKSFYNLVVKRCLDFLVAVFMLILLSPMFLVVALAIVFNTGFPVFYKGKRGGYKDKPFYMYKFRTMFHGQEHKGSVITKENDDRITKVGRFLRKHKLDEYPQLINIIKGEMSFVGPRPETYYYIDTFSEEDRKMLLVRPGITDYASLEFNNQEELIGDADPDEYYVKYILPRKNQLRLKYIEELSFSTDFKIFWVTVCTVLGKCVKKSKICDKKVPESVDN